MPFKDPEKRKACARRYNASHPEVLRVASIRYRANHPERYREQCRQSRARRIEYIKKYNHQYAVNLRARFLDIYGRECARCHTTDVNFLTIGHKNNDGKEERREHGYWSMLKHIVEHPDHTRYETQCYNCNYLEWLTHIDGKHRVDVSEHINKRNARFRNDRVARRKRFLEVYGLVCARCGEGDQRVLTVSHRKNDGASDRRQNKNNQTRLLTLAVENPDHAKYETLCWNCNRTAGAG